MPNPNVNSIAHQFAHPGQIIAVKPFGNGNINDTFLVSCADEAEAERSGQRSDKPAGDRQFVLQRINKQVFRQPQWVMENMKIVTEHIHHKRQTLEMTRRWETPRVILTAEGGDHFEDEAGSFWRAISFIDNSEAIDRIEDQAHAAEVGFALGMFHGLVSDIPAASLRDTLVGFHITPAYLEQYHEVLLAATIRQTPEIDRCLQWVSDRTQFATILEDAKRSGALSLRIMHGDPKVNNVMIDSTTQQAISMVDLDTVKPGLIHYDIGDCLRSGCNPLGEEVEDWEKVTFDVDRCEGILQGYLPQMKNVLTPIDYDLIYDAARLITFELGLRFLTDHLAGNQYFKVNYPEHNLHRAMVQFQLMESLESQEKAVRSIVESHQ
jgi:Ser/Thr protein kinase RdoA (MazF antagonist)